MRNEAKSVLLNSAAGTAAGCVSYFLPQSVYAAGMAILVAIIMRFVSRALFRENQKVEWWLGNGGVLFFLFWFISWVLVLNLARPLAA